MLDYDSDDDTTWWYFYMIYDNFDFVRKHLVFLFSSTNLYCFNDENVPYINMIIRGLKIPIIENLHNRTILYAIRYSSKITLYSSKILLFSPFVQGYRSTNASWPGLFI